MRAKTCLGLAHLALESRAERLQICLVGRDGLVSHRTNMSLIPISLVAPVIAVGCGISKKGRCFEVYRF